MLRKHIKVEPAAVLPPLRQARPLVWQDMPSGASIARQQFVAPNGKDASSPADEKAVYNRELKAMIDHLPFFPCIVAWVPFNEGWGQHDTNDVLNWVKKYDPTRLVDGPSGWADRGVGDMKDMHIYPRPGHVPGDAESRLRARRVRRSRPAAQGHICGKTRTTGATSIQDHGRPARRLPPADRRGCIR